MMSLLRREGQQLRQFWIGNIQASCHVGTMMRQAALATVLITEPVVETVD
jgi:hypothetical protein